MEVTILVLSNLPKWLLFSFKYIKYYSIGIYVVYSTKGIAYIEVCTYIVTFLSKITFNVVDLN
jgi:hypothetical protein